MKNSKATLIRKPPKTPLWLNIVLGMWWVWLSLIVLFIILGIGLYCQAPISHAHTTGLI